jgi:CIC family chloride channel protein
MTLSRIPINTSRTPLWSPTYRLLGFCVVVGLLGGFAAVFFEWAVELTQRFLLVGIGHYTPPEPGILPAAGAAAAQVPGWPERWWLPVATTLGGLLSGFIVYRWAPEAEGHGTDAAISAYHTQGGEVRARIPLVKAVASSLTIGSGGVAGREGPTAQIAVGLGGVVARLTGLRGQERRILLLASMAAGLAAMFQAPLGMAIFAVEILYSGMVFESEALIYTVVSAVSAYAVRGFSGGWSPIFAVPAGLTFTPMELVGYVFLGVLAGLLGTVLPSLFYWIRDLFRALPGPPHVRPAIGGLLVGLIGVWVPSVLGTGYGWVELALAGQLSFATLLLLLLFKAPAMALTIGSGGSGGVFAPTITVGAMLGAAAGMGLGYVLPDAGLSSPAFIIVGMAAVFAAAARTPISTLIMVAEMTGGYGLIVPAMLANTVAFVVQRTLTQKRRYPTLYEHQVPSREDSAAHRGVFVRRALQMLEGETLEPSELTLPRLVSLLRFGEPIPVTEKAGMLVAIQVEPGSALDGTNVAESVGRFEGATAVAVLRADEMMIPRGPTRIEAGDQLILIATPDAYEKLQEAAEAPEGEVEVEAGS